MFLGLSVHNLDDKGRITLPNKDRGAFTDSIVLLQSALMETSNFIHKMLT